MKTVTLNGEPVRLSGELPRVGDPCLTFQLRDTHLVPVQLSDFAGQRKLISILPSLDTPVCATSTREFNQRAAGLTNCVVLVVSADLPFAQGRFCSTEGLENVKPLSMMNSPKFAEDFGVLIVDGPLAGLSARAVVAVDAADRVIYSETVAEITQEPDYDRVMAALSQVE